ncbi:hypothetical protein EXIGLDRAFT_769174 [Exidia glandulosa HHB12029]|uniref:Uncharacterized protein n=1 Tax=Exidia glandulosa HHB12029 TaxID=1314781 RepID=A0A165HMN0_EXIGL|nr:hypothetical protein EXIGLDRAFT_769174 [Exidia glandulosa HHB12029]
MPRRNPEDFASEPDGELSDNDVPESPTQRLQKGKGKAAAAARSEPAPTPPTDPTPAMPRPKKAPEPSGRVTRCQVALGAAPAVPHIPLDGAPQPRTQQQGAPVRAPTRIPRGPVRALAAVIPRARPAALRPPAPRPRPVTPPTARRNAAQPSRVPRARPAATARVQKSRVRPANARRQAELDLGEDDDDFKEWWGVGADQQQHNDNDDVPSDEGGLMEEEEGEEEQQGDQEGESDDPPARVDRYMRPRQDVDVDDLRGQKRSQSMRASVASRSDVPSPPRKKRPGAGDVDAFAHFAPGRTADPYLSQISECARIIITGGFKQYLPLHFFSPEVRRAEEEARLLLRPDESILTRVPRSKVLESQATHEQFMTWTQLALKAFPALRVPEMIVSMYERHWGHVQTAEDAESEWTTWRDYDLRRRAQVKGDYPIDISELDLETLRLCRAATQAKLNAEMRAATVRYQRPSGAQATSSNAQASTSATAKTQALKVLKYSRCLICGSRTHTHDKDVARDDCDTLWLVRDERGTWKTPDTKAPICWMFNSVGGCSKTLCRFAKSGHRSREDG